MKRICLAMILSFCIASSTWAQLRIVTTATDYADIARQIGGEKAQVHSVMKGPENVHNVLAKPTEMLLLNQADLFVHSGLDTEPWRDNLLRGARNPKINIGQPGYVDMSSGIELKEVPTGKIDRSMGDIHAYGNPHFTLSPQAAQRMAVTLTKAMIAADPGNASIYQVNAEKFINSIADVSREIRAQFAPYAGLKVITFHKAWDYFADAIPIEIVGTIEPRPAITPSPAQVKQIIDLMKQQQVKIVICETYDDDKLAKFVADQAGAVMIVLPDHVLGVPQADSYQNLFRYNVNKLIEAARAAGIEPKPSAPPTGAANAP